MKRCRGIGHVYVTSRVSQQLHFIVDAAGESVGAICQREVSVDERVFRLLTASFVRKTTVVMRQRVAEADELLLGFLGGRGLGQAVMQMDFNFSPACVAEFRKLLH